MIYSTRILNINRAHHIKNVTGINVEAVLIHILLGLILTEYLVYLSKSIQLIL